MFGVVWADAKDELAETGYAYETAAEAEAIGHRGLAWFAAPQGELDDVLGCQVDWKDDSAIEPTGFWVDADHDENYRVWFDCVPVRMRIARLLFDEVSPYRGCEEIWAKSGIREYWLDKADKVLALVRGRDIPTTIL